jgi:cysteinyl-tRNA synthetase
MASEKMSKSLGNIVAPAELLAQGHRGETLRLALLSAHYRQPLPWTEGLVAQAKATLDGLYRKLGNAEPGDVDEGVLDALRDDLNTPLALSRLASIDEPSRLKASAGLFGLLNETGVDWAQGRITGSAHIIEQPDTMTGSGDAGPSEQQIDDLIEQRTEAKKNRDFVTADRIREELKADGIILEDGPTGTTWRRE